MRFAYARTGGPLLNWSGSTPPYPSRAGETRSLGDLDIPRPGAPEIVGAYESLQPGAAIVQLGGYMPEGAARSYGQTMLAADAPAPSFNPFTSPLVRKLGILASAYHGVKRHNGSIMWGLLWAAAAWATFPVNGLIVPGLAVAQGFAQPKGPKQNPARRRARRHPARRRVKRNQPEQGTLSAREYAEIYGEPPPRKRIRDLPERRARFEAYKARRAARRAAR